MWLWEKGDGFKQKKGKFRLGLGKKWFPMKVGRPWNGFPGEAVATISQELSRARLEHPGITERSWNKVIFKDLPNPNHSMVL